MARRDNLERFALETFDYIVVDEVHHADAKTWRWIIDDFRPRFPIGLTATPERGDADDIFGIFDDHVACRAHIGVGILKNSLVPFFHV